MNSNGCRVFALVLALCWVGILDAKQKTPNMVLFLADDLTYFDLGCYGGQADTPNIDRLAARGLRFTACYRGAAAAAPSRQNLFTGLYPVKSGAYGEGAFVQPGTKSMPHYLKALGYRVGLMGRRQVNPPEAYPFEYLNEDEGGLDVALLSDFILDCNDQPFLLLLAPSEPRFPWAGGDVSAPDAGDLTLPPNWIDTPQTRHCFARYLAAIGRMDKQVGTVTARLRDLGLLDHTLFMFASGQGASFPFSQWTCYEAGIHAPLIAHWPGVIERGGLCDALIEFTDVLPTLIDLAGGDIPAGLDGKSFKGLFLGGAGGGRDYTFAQQTTRGQAWASPYFGIRSVRDRRYTYIINFSPEALFDCRLTRFGDGYFNSWREAAWRDKQAAQRLLKYISRPPAELYDRSADPHEMHNLVGTQPYRSIQERLAAELREWMVQCKDKGQETELEALEHNWDHFRRMVEGRFD